MEKTSTTVDKNVATPATLHYIGGMEWFNQPSPLECPACGKTMRASFADMASGKFHCPFCLVRVRCENVEEVLSYSKELADGTASAALDSARVVERPVKLPEAFPAVFERLGRGDN